MIKNSHKLKYITEADSTIEEAWTKIEVNMHRSVIIVDKGRVVGTLSDGDLRKAMLARRLLSTLVKEVMNTHFIFLTKEEVSKAGKIFAKRDIFLIPVVDKNMRLLDLCVSPLSR